jgi:hypothetical protein
MRGTMTVKRGEWKLALAAGMNVIVNVIVIITTQEGESQRKVRTLANSFASLPALMMCNQRSILSQEGMAVVQSSPIPQWSECRVYPGR